MTELAKILAQYGPWGVVALLAGWIVLLFKVIEKSHGREIAMAERVLPLVEELRTALRMLAQRGGP